MKSFVFSKLLPRGAEMILALIFLLAAFSKIGDLSAFHKTLQEISFLPFWMQGLAVLLIPGLELVLGFYLLTFSRHSASALISLVLLSGFLILAIFLTLNGVKDCGCFKVHIPAWLQWKGWWVVFRDFLFVLLAYYVWQNAKRSEVVQKSD